MTSPRQVDEKTVRIARSWPSAVALIFCALAAVVWIGAVAGSADRGLDVSDEGYYLLSYRWWSTNLYNFTGVQFLYGPVYQAMDYNIAGLRLFRLTTVVVVHVLFGWTFMRWLRLRRPSAPQSRLWELAGTAAILACGGLAYGWLPLSPGYNDVTLLCAMMAIAILLAVATRVDLGERVPAWLPIGLGLVIVASLLAKWASTLVVVAIIAVAALLILAPSGRRETLRVIALTFAGAVLGIGLVHIFIVSLTAAIPEMLEVTKLVAAGGNSPTQLMRLYAETGLPALKMIGKDHYLLFIATAAAMVSRRPLVQLCAGLLAMIGFVVSLRSLAEDKAFLGGAVNLQHYPLILIAAVMVAGIAGFGFLVRTLLVAGDRSSLFKRNRREWIILATLLLLPAAQAMGTGNKLYYMAINGFALWFAFIIFVLSGIGTAPRVAKWLLGVVAASAVVLAASIGTTGVWQFPYRTDSHDRATARVHDNPALASVKLDPAIAGAYADFYEKLQPYVSPPGRGILAFDAKAGLVLLLDGQSVGEPWYSASDHARTAAGIRSKCEGGRGWPDARPPILLFARPVTDVEVDVLRSCGLSFLSDYRLLADKRETMQIAVYVPVREYVPGPR